MDTNDTTGLQPEEGTLQQESNVVFDDSGTNTEIVTVEVFSTPHAAPSFNRQGRSIIWNENSRLLSSNDVPPLSSNSLSWDLHGVQLSNTENTNGAMGSNLNFGHSVANGVELESSNLNNDVTMSSNSNGAPLSESGISNGNTYVCINSNGETLIGRDDRESKVIVQNGKIIIKSEREEDDVQALESEVPSFIEIKGHEDIDLSKVKSEFQLQYENLSEEKPHGLRKISKFNCEVCSKSFVSKKGYINHMASHGNESHECNICHKTYKSEELLKNHVKCHDETKRFQCEFCDKAYRQSTSLQQHYSVHSGEKTFFCDLCDQTFNYLTNFIRHKRRHEGKTYKCEICDKTFVEQTSIYRHKKLHNGQKEHECDVCGKLFFRAGNMREHRKTHEPREKKEKLFECEKCDKAYPYRSSLRKHYVKKHGESLPDLTGNVEWI